jgi:surfeit locus 1 family protein
MMRLPIFPTLVVALVCAGMVALGLWQLRRADEKAALLARYAANRSLSAEITFPMLAPVPDTALFRHSSAMCVEPVGWRISAGRTVKGQSGYRYIAECRTGAEGPGLLADMGVSTDPRAKPPWRGGLVHGVITLDPDQPGAITRLFRKPPPPRALLVSLAPAPGLEASMPPNPGDVPNNHLSYAVQWFAFAGIAAGIYLLAVRRRTMKAG